MIAGLPALRLSHKEVEHVKTPSHSYGLVSGSSDAQCGPDR